MLWLLFFVSSVEYEHVPPDLDERRVALLSSFSRDGFGCFLLQGTGQNPDFHHLGFLQLLLNLSLDLRS